jgi:hypothetical protein
MEYSRPSQIHVLVVRACSTIVTTLARVLVGKKHPTVQETNRASFLVFDRFDRIVINRPKNVRPRLRARAYCFAVNSKVAAKNGLSILGLLA